MANIIREAVLDSDPRVRDFRNFLWATWKELGLGTPTPIQYDMADWLQAGTHLSTRRAVGDRKILMGFRGVAKSYVTTAFCNWRLKRNRAEIVLSLSATERFAAAISSFAFQMINSFDWLADMRPTKDQRQSSLAFDVGGAPKAKDESFSALSITGQVTGHRGSVAVLDDVETPNTSDTEASRASLRRRVAEVPGAVIKPEGDIYMLGTAQTEDTIYKEYADQKGFELLIYPILYPSPEEMVKYGGHLAPYVNNHLTTNPALVGTSTEPTRFSELDIMQRRLAWGNTEFDRQFKMFMDAGSGKGSPLKMHDLIVIEIPEPKAHEKDFRLPAVIDFYPGPATKLELRVDSRNGDSTVYGPNRTDEWVPAEEVIAFVDPSGAGSDETSTTVLAGLLGRVFLCDQWGSLDGHSDAVLEEIAARCKKWRVTRVLVESDFGQGMMVDLLIPHFAKINHPVLVEHVRAGKTQKEKKIVQTLEPLITGHRLAVNADVIRRDMQAGETYEDIEAELRRYYRLTYQLSRMTTAKGCVKHDDRADSLASGCAYFIGVLQRQLEEAEKEARVRAIELEVERMIALRKQQGLPLFGLDAKKVSIGRPNRASSFGRHVR